MRRRRPGPRRPPRPPRGRGGGGPQRPRPGRAGHPALAAAGSSATLTPVWTGDFNDPTRAQQFTGQLLADGNDVILTSPNPGAVGALEGGAGRRAAPRPAPARPAPTATASS